MRLNGLVLAKHLNLYCMFVTPSIITLTTTLGSAEEHVSRATRSSTVCYVMELPEHQYSKTPATARHMPRGQRMGPWRFQPKRRNVPCVTSASTRPDTWPLPKFNNLL